MAGSVHATRDGAIATVTLDHPERLNALSTPMWRQLGEIAAEASQFTGVQVFQIGIGQRQVRKSRWMCQERVSGPTIGPQPSPAAMWRD